MTCPLIYLPHRAVLSITGPDTLSLLDRLVTHNVHDWSCGMARYGALLSPQGKVVADYLALRMQEGLWLDVARDVLPVLAERLHRLRLRSDVSIGQCPHMQVFAGLQPVPDTRALAAKGVHPFADPRYHDKRIRVFVNTDAAGELDIAGDPFCADYHRARIGRGVPEQGIDFGTGMVFPADINMDRFAGLDFQKGCFIGQEVVSRMHRRGKLRKRTLTLILPPDFACQTGADIVADGLIGTVTSREAELALALVRIDRLARAQAAGQKVTIDNVPVTVAKNAWLKEQMAMIAGG